MRKLLTVLEMIKFEHTVFALPFAFLGAFLAAGGFPGWRTSGWIVAAMVGARSCAMAFNRLADHHLDARNPRTSMRALPAGRLSRGFVAGFAAVSALLFLFSTWMLNPLAFLLSPVALAVVLGYSYSKRFTSGSHLLLGLALGLAPLGGWVAVRASLDPEPLWLAGAVLFWVVGFDIIYACQDYDFDRRVRLFSIPVRVGIRRALWVAAGCHVIMVLLLSIAFSLFDLSLLSWSGLLLAALGLAYEHSLVRADDLSRVNLAFFTLNGVISVVLFLFVGLDLCLRG